MSSKQYNIIILIISLLILYPIKGLSQNNWSAPQWLTNTPSPSNPTYEFKTFRIQSRNIKDAKSKLPDEVAYYMERNFSVRGASIEVSDVSHIYKNGKLNSVEIEKITDTVYTIADKVNIKLRVIDEYQTDRDVYFLCAIPNPETQYVVYDQMTVTSNYGVKGLWRSAIVPGWGQFYKRSYLKGGLILGGSVLLAGGIVYTECMRADYWKKQRNGYANGTEQIQFYYQKEKNFAIARNVCIGGLCALYVYNLIDAIVAPGARYVKVSKTDHNGNVYTLAPTINYDGSPMLAGSIRF